MAMKTILFLALFALSVCGALYYPMLGVLGYVAHYITGPDRQWWTAAIRPYDIRYSFVLGAATVIGMVLNFRKLRYGAQFFTRHEKLMLLFLGLLWVLYLAGEATTYYTIVDHPVVKITKVMAFGLMMTHIVTTERSLRVLLWTFVICTLILGLQAYTTPREMGRLEGVGGADFAEANFLPAFIGAMLPLIGVLFFQTRWWGKVLCLVSGVFAVNAIILARSRGALVGIALGMVPAVFLAPRRFRGKVLVGLIVAGLGAAYLTDPGFWGRMSTINRPEEELDASAQQRFDLWNISIRIVKDHPLGIGPGNWFQTVGRYNPELKGRDAHSTYFRCLAELGVPGFLLFAGVAGHAVWVALRAFRRVSRIPTEAGKSLYLLCYGYTVSLFTFLGVGIAVTALYTEALWWLLILPVCLERAVDNLIAESVPAAGPGKDPAKAEVEAKPAPRKDLGRSRRPWEKTATEGPMQ
jgi:O-antigen ligase